MTIIKPIHILRVYQNWSLYFLDYYLGELCHIRHTDIKESLPTLAEPADIWGIELIEL